MAKVVSSIGGSSITRTSQLINDGESSSSEFVEEKDLSDVAFSGDYNDLINTPGYLEGDKHYVHDQGVPSNFWTIIHNLNKMPTVVIVDSAGTVVEGSVRYSQDNPLNELTVSFNGSFSGKGFLN